MPSGQTVQAAALKISAIFSLEKRSTFLLEKDFVSGVTSSLSGIFGKV